MSKINYKVKAVIFDMDGVITNTMPDHYRSWKVILDKEGIPLTHHDVYIREGQPGQFFLKEILPKYNKVYSEKLAKRILHEKEEYFKGIVKTRFVVGARSFLKGLHKRNFCLALVTGTSRHELHKILPQHLLDLFSVIITGTDVKKGKPHPEPYLRSLNKLNLKPCEAVVIENAPFGIQAAKSAGMKCLALETSLSKGYLKEANGVFISFKALCNKVSFNLLSS